MPRQKTKTSSFGTSKREGHDATQFYSSNLYEGLKLDETQVIIDHSNTIPPSFFTKPDLFSLEFLKEIPANSLHFIIFDTSGLLNQVVFEDRSNSLLELFFHEYYRALITGGRIAIIVDNHEKLESSSNFHPFHAEIALKMIQKGFLMRGEIVWKLNQENPSDANRNRQEHAHLPLNYSRMLVFSKQIMKREKKLDEDTISRDQFLQYTKSIWRHQPNLLDTPEISADNTINLEIMDLYARLEHLYTFKSDKILAVIPLKNKASIEVLQQVRKNQILRFLEKME